MEKVIVCCDCDGTLVYDTENNEIVPREEVRALIIALSGMINIEIYVWSGGGITYAKQIVNQLGLGNRIVNCIEKGSIRPTIAIDDEPETNLGEINIIVPDPDHMNAPAEAQTHNYQEGVQAVMLAIAEHGMVDKMPGAFFEEFKHD